MVVEPEDAGADSVDHDADLAVVGGRGAGEVGDDVARGLGVERVSQGIVRPSFGVRGVARGQSSA